MNTAVIGLQFGDEGKGKIVDYLAQHHDIVARFSGGSNAGHTVIYDGKKVSFHLVPSGVLSGKIGVLGNGTAINPWKLEEELEMLGELGIDARILISSRAHVVTPLHQEIDGIDDELLGIGTTRQGIGPAYVAKYRRVGIRVHELLDAEILRKKLRLIARMHGVEHDERLVAELVERGRKIKGMITDTELWLNNAMDSGKSVLFEGSQGTYLDVDFGTYPYVTSSSTTVGGIVTGLGIPPQKIHRVVGVAKAYTTRVGSGPFPTEFAGEEESRLRERGAEFGATTGRARRVGALDMSLLRYATLINGVTDIALTKVDVLQGSHEIVVGTKYVCNGTEYEYPPPELEGCSVRYVHLPGWNDIEDDALEKFVEYIENETGARVSMVSYGPERDKIMVR